MSTRAEAVQIRPEKSAAEPAFSCRIDSIPASVVGSPDSGTGFNFEGLTHAAINNPSDNPMEHREAWEANGLRLGGLGLLMTQSLVDELVHNEAQNELRCVKYLE
jgi:hypothetical protein